MKDAKEGKPESIKAESETEVPEFDTEFENKNKIEKVGKVSMMNLITGRVLRDLSKDQDIGLSSAEVLKCMIDLYEIAKNIQEES